MKQGINDKASVSEGADLIARNWIHLRKKDSVLIVTTKSHTDEAKIMKERFLRITDKTDIMMVNDEGKTLSTIFDEKENAFDDYDVIVGATDYSIVTTRAVKRALDKGKRFLSLPLSTNNGSSLLEYPFLKMDTGKSRLMAGIIRKYLDESTVIRIETAEGTELKVFKKSREVGFFNGSVKDNRGFSSASIELYIPVEEDRTEGIMAVTGSLGYLGRVTEPFKIRFSKGRIIDIEETKDGKRLKEYLESFGDSNMYAATELGIGLNSDSECIGNSYIEDESAYGTFHIGFGRNIALGGVHEAKGHFDLVSYDPDIYADNRMVMYHGVIVDPEPQVF